MILIVSFSVYSCGKILSFLSLGGLSLAALEYHKSDFLYLSAGIGTHQNYQGQEILLFEEVLLCELLFLVVKEKEKKKYLKSCQYPGVFFCINI